MSVLDDIMKKRNPLSSQGVATQAAAVQPNTATQSAVNNGAAVTQMPKTGFNAEIAKVAQNVVDNMNRQGVTPTAQPNSAVPSATPPAQPQQLSYVDMLNKMYTPETAEERAKRERREKWDKTAAAIGDGISALANLYYTTKGAPNSYDGKNSMSERTRQLYEKLDRDRRENERWYLNHYMNAAKMDADEAKAERSWKNTLEMQKQAQENADRNFEAQEKQRKWQREHAEQQAQFQKEQASEKNRQFWASLNTQVQNIKRQLEKENQPFDMVLGDGKHATIKKSSLHAHNVSYVYNKIPESIRKEINPGKPRYDKYGTLEGYDPPTQEQMLAVIGQYVGQYPEVQEAWKEVGGEITTSTQQSGGGGKHSHRVGGNNSATDI